VHFEGRYYQVRGATLLPRPQRLGGPRILIGGNGEKRTLSYVARYGNEWNCVTLSPQDFAALNQRLDALLKEAGREPESVRRSMMTGCVFGKDDQALQKKFTARGRTADQLRQRGVVAGNAQEVNEQLRELEQAGLQRIMLQWLDLDDLEGLNALAKAVL
jgi:alkanesulfonate monooxygenase SsuD/methylene tetrahydromethanopterin reductase-like flavin-dependent oxidoreductase (luciferase family)